MNDPKELTAEEAEQMEARNRLKQRFGSNAQIGGKGNFILFYLPIINIAFENVLYTCVCIIYIYR